MFTTALCKAVCTCYWATASLRGNRLGSLWSCAEQVFEHAALCFYSLNASRNLLQSSWQSHHSSGNWNIQSATLLLMGFSHCLHQMEMSGSDSCTDLVITTAILLCDWKCSECRVCEWSISCTSLAFLPVTVLLMGGETLPVGVSFYLMNVKRVYGVTTMQLAYKGRLERVRWEVPIVAIKGWGNCFFGHQAARKSLDEQCFTQLEPYMSSCNPSIRTSCDIKPQLLSKYWVKHCTHCSKGMLWYYFG